MASVKALSRREELFVEAVVAGKSNRQAAIAAGYAPSGAASIAHKLTQKNRVKVQIELRRRGVLAQMQDETLFALVRIGKELDAVAHSDPKDLFDAEGKFLPVHEMPEPIRRAISSVDVDESWELVDGPKATTSEPAAAEMEQNFLKTRTVKVRFWPKVAALEAMARLGGHLKQDSEIGGEIVLRWAGADD